MKRNWALLALLLTGCGEDAVERPVSLPAFGTVTIYQHDSAPTAVAYLFSGSDGVTETLASQAWGLAWPSRTVIAVDTTRFLSAADDKAGCKDVASAFAQLDRTLSAKTGPIGGVTPLLLGSGIGGTVALGIATAGVAADGVVAEDFCPQPPPVAICGLANAGDRLAPPEALTVPFVAIPAQAECAADSGGFVAAMPDARLVPPKPERAVDLLIAIANQTGAQRSRGPEVTATELSDLPLVELPATGTDDRLVVVLTGDGGWADIDKSIGAALQARGLAVVGFDMLKYFWSGKTPKVAAADLDRILRHYTTAWGRSRVVLLGYSFGASVLPFLEPQLSPETRRQIALTALVVPSERATFEIKVGDWIGQTEDEGPEVGPALAALGRTLCISNDDDDSSPCPSTASERTVTLRLPGDHHFDGRYGPIVAAVVKESESAK